MIELLYCLQKVLVDLAQLTINYLPLTPEAQRRVTMQHKAGSECFHYSQPTMNKTKMTERTTLVRRPHHRAHSLLATLSLPSAENDNDILLHR
jgi:hypothetical protein